MAARIPLLILARIFRSGSAVMGGLLVLYFTLFAFEGDRGYTSFRHTQQQVTEAEARLAQVRTQREAIERKVVALRPASIDPDMLEEQARSELGFVRPGDIVILGR